MVAAQIAILVTSPCLSVYVHLWALSWSRSYGNDSKGQKPCASGSGGGGVGQIDEGKVRRGIPRLSATGVLLLS